MQAEKKQLKEAADADRTILERASLNIDLVEESEEDKRLAGLMKYSVTSCKFILLSHLYLMHVLFRVIEILI